MMIVLLSPLGTPVYGSHVLEGGDGCGGSGSWGGEIGTSFFYLNILPISISGVTSKP